MHAISATQLSSHVINFHLHLRHFSPRGFSPRSFSPRGFPRYFLAVGTVPFLILNATWSDFWISSETSSENASAILSENEIWSENESGTWNENGTWNEIWSANDGCVVIVMRTWSDFLSGIVFALDCPEDTNTLHKIFLYILFKVLSSFPATSYQFGYQFTLMLVK